MCRSSSLSVIAVIYPVRTAIAFLVLLFFPFTSFSDQTPESPHDRSLQVAPQPLLNSERIRQQFGSYGIEVIEADEQLRISNLYSLSDGIPITRTLAIVLFPDPMPEAVADEHALITSGGSIGEVFKSHGWQVEKENLYFGEVGASQAYAGVYEMMGGIAATDLAMHVYELSVRKGCKKVDYAIIAEVHHPAYLDLVELETIYNANGDAADAALLPPPTLETVRQSLSGF